MGVSAHGGIGVPFGARRGCGEVKSCLGVCPNSFICVSIAARCTGSFTDCTIIITGGEKDTGSD
jgi:hypothetical protein